MESTVNLHVLLFYYFFIVYCNSNTYTLDTQLDNLTAEDINLEVPNEESGNIINHPSGAPVSHIGIYECPYFSMGVFIIKKGCEIPLHDHPGMYGLW